MAHTIMNWVLFALLVVYLLIAISVADDNFKTLWMKAKNAYIHHQVTPLKVFLGVMDCFIILLISGGWLGVIIGHYITLPFRKKP